MSVLLPELDTRIRLRRVWILREGGNGDVDGRGGGGGELRLQMLALFNSLSHLPTYLPVICLSIHQETPTEADRTELKMRM